MGKKSNIWYVDFPTYRYNEDVKALASKNGLKVVDSRFKGDDEGTETVPKLTLKKEYSSDQKDDPKSDREVLKQKANTLGIEFANNISTDKLAALIEEKEKGANNGGDQG